MIDIKKITQKDIGKWVTFLPHKNSLDNKKELGKIKSYNSIFIYVVYKCAGEWDRFKAYTGIPTDPNMLNFCKASKPTKSEILYEGRDYDSSVKEANK